MDLAAFYRDEFAEHAAVAEATRAALAEPFARLVGLAVASIEAGGKLIFFGNGGSAADAQHLATELSVRYIANRKAIPALALTTDSSALTAIGNDLGFDLLFARQVEALCRKEDMVIGITTSGRSPNVIKGLQAAQDIGAVAAALTGKDGGDLTGLADPLLIVPSNTTARIQEMHITLGQMLCGALEKKLGLA
ncbi:D-sedoheptulose 7-phosphate isomerase [Oceanibaculum pacificum]|uniref:Phosphoheptose isomerase n=1 Tax=Oceanibaculum pacificum TaxID=580166 RepID=A0A154WBU2_9PROT|nr:D-sedoheptulose 7-phosphate isomerase [Oceanibaculum pacificum]KZD10994.1 phosphoheptose isomerase [Oceanibaculum pacificum]